MKKLFIILILLPFIGKSQGTVVDSAGNIISSYLSIGTKQTTSPLTVTNFPTAFPAPQVGTLVHLVSSGIATNARISFDNYNGSNVLGPVYQGRRAGGSAGSPCRYEKDTLNCWLVVLTKATRYKQVAVIKCKEIQQFDELCQGNILGYLDLFNRPLVADDFYILHKSSTKIRL